MGPENLNLGELYVISEAYGNKCELKLKGQLV